MINNDIYYKKYLKYKKKYTKLKGQIGGECPSSNKGYTKAQLIKQGCTKDKFDISSITRKEIDDHNQKTGMKTEQITFHDLKRARFIYDEIKALGFNIVYENDINKYDQLIKRKLSKDTASQLKRDGYSVDSLIFVGFTVQELKDAGFSIDEFKSQGITVNQLKDVGFTVQEFKRYGYTVAQLTDAGVTVKELKDAGFSIDEFKRDGFTIQQIKNVGFTVQEFKKNGYTVLDLKKHSITVKELKNAGVTVKELKDAGFTVQELKDAEFTVQEIEQEIEQEISRLNINIKNIEIIFNYNKSLLTNKYIDFKEKPIIIQSMIQISREINIEKKKLEEELKYIGT